MLSTTGSTDFFSRMTLSVPPLLTCSKMALTPAVLARLHDVDENVFAVVAQLFDVAQALQAESLHHERGFQPRAVEAADKHANFQVSCRNLQGMEHCSPVTPLFRRFLPLFG
jgi:hypothetical protein